MPIDRHTCLPNAPDVFPKWPMAKYIVSCFRHFDGMFRLTWSRGAPTFGARTTFMEAEDVEYADATTLKAGTRRRCVKPARNARDRAKRWCINRTIYGRLQIQGPDSNSRTTLKTTCAAPPSCSCRVSIFLLLRTPLITTLLKTITQPRSHSTGRLTIWIKVAVKLVLDYLTYVLIGRKLQQIRLNKKCAIWTDPFNQT